MSDPAKTTDFEIQETQSGVKGEVPNTYWRMVGYHFKKRKPAVFGLWVTIFLFFVAIFAFLLANDKPIIFYHQGSLNFPVFSGAEKIGSFVFKDLKKENPFIYQHVTGKENAIAIWPLVKYSSTEYNLLEYLSPPDAKHWFGTDDSGRDVLSRMIWGAQVSLSVGFVAVGIAMAIGILLGALAGYFGGWTDIVISRAIEIMLTIPTFFLIIAVVAILSPNIFNIMVVIGLTGWTGAARFVRAEFLKLKQLDFIMALRALGASDKRIIFLHMLPNAMAPVLVSAVFGIAGAILTESSLSFLGFGVPPPTPSWGDILSQSRDYIEFAWWLTVFPGFAIFISITAYNLVGEGLRDAMDPKLFR
ncbi:Dipeptide transport system permease protein DppC (modular protein) [Syntrophobacter sp. SbD1]|nr:Dipeptide transport system permease protein DppC (modular protein) [Syntrophobacter sp. SbD1]